MNKLEQSITKFTRTRLLHEWFSFEMKILTIHSKYTYKVFLYVKQMKTIMKMKNMKLVMVSETKD